MRNNENVYLPNATVHACRELLELSGFVAHELSAFFFSSGGHSDRRGIALPAGS
jgi:hypothetical protein